MTYTKNPTRRAMVLAEKTAKERAILDALTKRPRPSSELCDDLAARVGSKSEVSRRVSELRKRGLIEFDPDRKVWMVV